MIKKMNTNMESWTFDSKWNVTCINLAFYLQQSPLHHHWIFLLQFYGAISYCWATMDGPSKDDVTHYSLKVLIFKTGKSWE